MYVCICVCMYICIYIYIHTYMHRRRRLNTCLFLRMCALVCLHACKCIFIAFIACMYLSSHMKIAVKLSTF